jgi:hypothetical protein
MLTLFAQFNQNQNAGAPPPEVIAMILGFYCVAFLISLLIKSLYILSLSKTLRQCRPSKRTMEPGQLWLYLVPLFELIWHFFIVIRMSESLKKEFRRRGLRSYNDDFGYTLGLWMCILIVVACVPYIGCCTALPGFICWIIYWVKMVGFGRQLADDEFYGDEREDDDPWHDERDSERDDDEKDRRDDEGNDRRDDEDDRDGRKHDPLR